MISEQRKAESKMPGQRMYIEGYCPELFIELTETLPVQPVSFQLKLLAKGISNLESKNKTDQDLRQSYVKRCNDSRILPFSEQGIKYNLRTNTFIPPGYENIFSFGPLSKDVQLQDNLLQSYLDLCHSHSLILGINSNEHKNEILGNLNLNQRSNSSLLEAEVQEMIGKGFQKFKDLSLLSKLFRKDYHLSSGYIDLNGSYSPADEKFFPIGGTKFGYKSDENLSYFKLGGVLPEHHKSILSDWFESLESKYTKNP